MKLAEIVKQCEALAVDGRVDRDITGITYDSRRVAPGNLFVAVRGARTDGHRFISSAIDRGATAIVVEQTGGFSPRATQIRVADARRTLALAAAQFYDH